jgi:hypothetical protein
MEDFSIELHAQRHSIVKARAAADRHERPYGCMNGVTPPIVLKNSAVQRLRSGWRHFSRFEG